MSQINSGSSSSQGISNVSDYPYDYMDEKSISHYLYCCVCTRPFVDPVTSANNRHGCRSCFASNEGPFKDITEAIVVEMLNGLLVRCRLCEEGNIRRGFLKTHEQTVCPGAIVRCKAADIKCTWEGRREFHNRHLAECIFEPLRPALEEIITENQQLRVKIEQLERLLNSLK